MITKLSIITTHFFDFEWTNLLVKNILKFTEKSRILEIIIINQDRSFDSHTRLEDIGPLIKVIEYPKSEIHFKAQGHDHANVLNKAIGEINGEYLCILDSDAHPINTSWLIVCEEIFENFDAILALVPGRATDTHPCFMIMKKACLECHISFDENLFTDNIDTGRLIGKQLLSCGKKVFFSNPNTVFNGLWGKVYINSIYHHEKGGFSKASDTRILKHINWKINFFKKFVIEKNRYELRTSEYLQFKIKSNIHELFR